MAITIDAAELVVGQTAKEGGGSIGADTKANTIWGGGALELGDSRLFEDGSKREGARDSDVIDADAAGEGHSKDGEKTIVSRGADT